MFSFLDIENYVWSDIIINLIWKDGDDHDSDSRNLVHAEESTG